VGDHVIHIYAFRDVALFAAFDLPTVLPDK
jgi:hypothetical protein